MSSSQVYSNLAGVCNAETIPNVTNNVTSQWYAPNSYAYDASYMTPFPSSTMESQPWPQLSRAPMFDSLSQYSINQTPVHSHFPQFIKDTNRPRSSPSTFGMPDNVSWQPSHGLGINYSSAGLGQLTPVTSTFPPAVFQAYAADASYGKGESILNDEPFAISNSPPEIKAPQPRRATYMNIAPHPAGVEVQKAEKRKRNEEEQHDSASLSTKRRKRTSSVASADLSEDDRFLVTLKEHENLPWKDIANRYSSEKGKNVQVAALQMRYKRLREKYRVWSERDVSALRSAHEAWEKRKWEIISEKMLEYGIEERWNPRQCMKKWQELGIPQMPVVTTATITPAMSHTMSQFSSPIDAPPQFAFVPIGRMT